MSASKKGAEADSNKENEDQGNRETKENKQEEIDGDVLNDPDFQRKYEKLQQQWLNGHRSEKDLDPDLVKKYGDHAYILQYILENNEIQKENGGIDKMVFHPNYSYIYSDYEKKNILELMNESQLEETQKIYESHIQRLESKIFDGLAKAEKEREEKEKEKGGSDDEDNDKHRGGWIVPEYSIPIRADIRKFDFVKLAETQRKLSGRLFDAIMMDPPWQLATANPTRGVAIGLFQCSFLCPNKSYFCL